MKSVLVTGGVTRVGATIVEHLRAAGWRVLVSSHRVEAGADILADLSTAAGPDKLFAEARNLLGGALPDALVNNAALFTGDVPTLRAVNVHAPTRLMALMAAREVGVGAVVNILDALALRPEATARADYLQTKRDLLTETQRAARDFAATLRVNAVAPGAVLKPTNVHEKAAQRLLTRQATADDVAEAVLYLLSAEAVTGVILPVDAGVHCL